MSPSLAETSRPRASLPVSGSLNARSGFRASGHGLLVTFGLSFAVWNRPYMPLVLLGALAVSYKWLRALADRRIRIISLACLSSLFAIHYWSDSAGAPWDLEQRDLVSMLAFYWRFCRSTGSSDEAVTWPVVCSSPHLAWGGRRAS